MTGKTSDGFVVYRKEKIFDDGSRVVEESTLLSKLDTTTSGGTAGGNGSNKKLMAMMGWTNIISSGGNSRDMIDIEMGMNRKSNNNDIGDDNENNQLQPMYNSDGNPYVVALLIFLKYGMPTLLFIIAWTKRVKRVKDVLDDGDENKNYNQNDDYGYWYYNNP